MVKYKPTYWNNKGKFQKEYTTLWNKYVPDEGYRILIDRKLARLMGYSEKQIKEAVKSIRKLIRISNRYYRFYNDGDNFVWEGKKFIYGSEADEKMLDKIVDKIVERAWKATDRARMPAKAEKIRI